MHNGDSYSVDTYTMFSKCQKCWCIKEIMPSMNCLTKWLQTGYAHAINAPPQQFSVCFAYFLKLNRIIRWKRYSNFPTKLVADEIKLLRAS